MKHNFYNNYAVIYQQIIIWRLLYIVYSLCLCIVKDICYIYSWLYIWKNLSCTYMKPTKKIVQKQQQKVKYQQNHIITIDILPLFSDVSDIVKTKLEGNFQFQIESLDGVVGFPFKYRRLFLALRQHVSS